jgi:hypothetical protein
MTSLLARITPVAIATHKLLSLTLASWMLKGDFLKLQDSIPSYQCDRSSSSSTCGRRVPSHQGGTLTPFTIVYHTLFGMSWSAHWDSKELCRRASRLSVHICSELWSHTLNTNRRICFSTSIIIDHLIYVHPLPKSGVVTAVHAKTCNAHAPLFDLW